MAKEIYITGEGLKKLEAELDTLKSVRRKEVSEKIKLAISFGDLSENSEYDEAKNEQAIIESRIAEIETQLKNVRLLDESELAAETIHVGSIVRVKNLTDGGEETYRLVGSAEADPLAGSISYESPVGKALLDGAVGDTVEVVTPGGAVSYTVLEVGR